MFFFFISDWHSDNFSPPSRKLSLKEPEPEQEPAVIVIESHPYSSQDKIQMFQWAKVKSSERLQNISSPSHRSISVICEPAVRRWCPALLSHRDSRRPAALQTFNTPAFFTHPQTSCFSRQHVSCVVHLIDAWACSWQINKHSVLPQQMILFIFLWSNGARTRVWCGDCFTPRMCSGGAVGVF